MKKSKKMLFKIFVILLALLILFIISLNIINNSLKTDSSDNTSEVSSMHTEEPVLNYENTIFEVYKGKVDPLKISNCISGLFELYLPMISEDVLKLDDIELKQYFEKEKERIYLNLGIQDDKKFLNFINKIKELNCNLDEITYIRYKEGSYVSGKENDTIEFEIGYENSKSLKCKSYIPLEYNKSETEIFVIEMEILDVL